MEFQLQYVHCLLSWLGFDVFPYLLCLSQEILRHSNAASELSASDASEALKAVFERTGVSHMPEELTLLTEKMLAGAGGNHISAPQLVEFCANEADRHEWTLVGNRCVLITFHVVFVCCRFDTSFGHFLTCTL